MLWSSHGRYGPNYKQLNCTRAGPTKDLTSFNGEPLWAVDHARIKVRPSGYTGCKLRPWLDILRACHSAKAHAGAQVFAPFITALEVETFMDTSVACVQHACHAFGPARWAKAGRTMKLPRSCCSGGSNSSWAGHRCSHRPRSKRGRQCAWWHNRCLSGSPTPCESCKSCTGSLRAWHLAHWALM